MSLFPGAVRIDSGARRKGKTSQFLAEALSQAGLKFYEIVA